MLQALDDFFGRYPHLVAAVEAFSTLAAVVVCLLLASLAQRANRTKLRAYLFIAQLVQEGVDPKNPPAYMALSVTNKGVMPLTIPFAFFCWRIPFQRQWRFPFTRQVMLVYPLDYFAGDRHIPPRRYPVPIPPRSMERFYLSTGEKMKTSLRDIYKDQRLLGRFLFRFLHAKIETEDGAAFRVNFDKRIREEIKAARKLRLASAASHPDNQRPHEQR
jgi:hypothetical protein